ncbi:MAG: hypothetical protein ACRD3W_25265, partial [Terriglobales bacterium]
MDKPPPRFHVGKGIYFERMQEFECTVVRSTDYNSETGWYKYSVVIFKHGLHAILSSKEVCEP